MIKFQKNISLHCIVISQSFTAQCFRLDRKRNFCSCFQSLHKILRTINKIKGSRISNKVCTRQKFTRWGMTLKRAKIVYDSFKNRLKPWYYVYFPRGITLVNYKERPKLHSKQHSHGIKLYFLKLRISFHTVFILFVTCQCWYFHLKWFDHPASKLLLIKCFPPKVLSSMYYFLFIIFSFPMATLSLWIQKEFAVQKFYFDLLWLVKIYLELINLFIKV